MFDPECHKDRRTSGEPESFSDKPHHEAHAQKARVKHPPLQPGQDPLEHTPVLRSVGVLLWASLRTLPDIAWAVPRITRLASSDEARARVCIRHVARYLRWTLHFALFYEPIQDLKCHCYTDASWAPEGDYSHQAVANHLRDNLSWLFQAQPARLGQDAMRASWLHHPVKHENVSMQFVPTAHQKADLLCLRTCMNLLDKASDYRFAMACENMRDLPDFTASVQVVDFMLQPFLHIRVESEHVWVFYSTYHRS